MTLMGSTAADGWGWRALDDLGTEAVRGVYGASKIFPNRPHGGGSAASDNESCAFLGEEAEIGTEMIMCGSFEE